MVGRIPVFGTPAQSCRTRRGVYGVTLRGEQVLLVRWRERLHLPGGGVSGDESPTATLRREYAEETGLRVVDSAPLCEAHAYVRLRTGEIVLKAGRFHLVDVADRPTGRPEPGHETVWLPTRDAVRRMIDPAGAYAIRQAMRV